MTMQPLDASTQPQDHYFEDYRPGTVSTFGPIPIHEADVVEFARRYDPQPIHTDPRAAAAGPFGGGLHTGRAVNVIKAVAERAGWGRTLPAGRGLGLAFHFSHQGHFAEVAEVSVDANKKVDVHKVWVVADIGPIVNLSTAENQCQGSVIDALSTAMGLKITFEGGKVEQTIALHTVLNAWAEQGGPELDSAQPTQWIDTDSRLGNTGAATWFVQMAIGVIGSYREGGATAAINLRDPSEASIVFITPPPDDKRKNQHNAQGGDVWRSIVGPSIDPANYQQ